MLCAGKLRRLRSLVWETAMEMHWCHNTLPTLGLDVLGRFWMRLRRNASVDG